MINLLEQAQRAAEVQDWVALHQDLQAGLNASEHLTLTEAKNWLNLAILALEVGDFQERWELSKLIPKLGNIALETVIKLLENEETEEELCWFLVRIIAEFKSYQSIQILGKFLMTSQSEELTAMAALALSKMGTPAIALLTDLLAQPDTRGLAVRSLCAIDSPQIIPPLLQVASETNPDLQVLVVEALSRFSDPETIPILIENLYHSSADVRRVAVIGVGLRASCIGEPKAIALLRDRLRDLNPSIGQQAAIALSRINTPAAAQTLFTGLESALIPLQLEIVRSLAWMGNPEALNFLQQALENPAIPLEVCREIITVLGRCPQELAALASQILIKLLKATPSPELKPAIAHSLGQLRDIQSLNPLMNLLGDPDSRVRFHAIAALKPLMPTALEYLKQQTQGFDLTAELKQGIAIAIRELTLIPLEDY